MSLIKTMIGKITGGGEVIAAPSVHRPSAGYMRNGRNMVFAGWRPTLREAQTDVAEAWQDAAARAIDTIQNSGFIAGAVEQAVANTVGTGLRLKASPENSLFGMDEKSAREWSRLAEARFNLWADNAQECDIKGQKTFGQMQAQGFRSWIATGEILSELPVRRRPWNTNFTKVRLMSPHRLTRQNDDMKRLINGVYTNADGMPIGYRARRKDPLWGWTEYDVAARDRRGRRRVIHVFSGEAETYRGIGPLTPVLMVARQFDQLSDATLSQAILQTLFAATVTGDAPTEEVMEGLMTSEELARSRVAGFSPFEAYMDMLGGFYEAGVFDTSINGRVAHMFPGQTLDFHSAQTPGIDYKEFTKRLLMEISRCLGMTYQSATGDYEGSSYATLNNATAEVYGVTKLRRQHVMVPFCQPIYEAFLEEEVATGRLPFPGGYEAFMANKAAVCRAEWRGPPRPDGDALKQAKSHQVWESMGVMSHEMIANDLGVDIEDVYAARAREKQMREDYGLPEPVVAQSAIQSPDGGGDSGEGGGDGPDA